MKKVLHLVHTWIEYTTHWIETVVMQNTQFESWVYTRHLLEKKHPLVLQYKVLSPLYKNPLHEKGLEYLARLQNAYTFEKSTDFEDFDLFHAHFAWEAWRRKKILNQIQKPLIVTFYGVDVHKLSRRIRLKQSYEWLKKRASICIAEGPFMLQSLNQMGFDSAQLFELRIGIPLENYPASPARAHGEECRVIFVGLNREKKGALDAAMAFAMAAQDSPALQLHVVGTGPYQALMVKIFEDYNVLDSVHFHGRLAPAHYRKVLSQMHIALVPSKMAADGDSEGGAPVVCIEAMASGIPVVGTSHCDIPYLVKHLERGHISAEGDIESIASALSNLCSNEELRLEWGRNGQTYAYKEHDIQLQIHKLNRIYKQVLNS